MVKFSLTLLDTCFRIKPDLMNEHFNYFMFEVLPSFIDFGKQDIELALSSPSDFILYENLPKSQDYNMRLYASHIWKQTMINPPKLDKDMIA